MTPEEIREGNKLIALFMGYTKHEDSNCVRHPDFGHVTYTGNLLYDVLPEKLAPVLTKIASRPRVTIDQKMGTGNNGAFCIFNITDFGAIKYKKNMRSSSKELNPLKLAYEAVVAYLKWLDSKNLL